MDSLNLSSKDWTAADLPGVYNPEVQTQPGIGEFSTPSSEFHPSSPRISRWNIVDAAPTALNTACSGTSYMLALLLAARISFGSVRWFFAPKVPGSQLWIFFLLALFWGLVSALVGRTGWGTANKRALFGYLRAEIVFLLGLGEAYALGAKLNVCEAFLVASLLYVLMALILGNAAMHIARSGQLVRHDANILIVGTKDRARQTIAALGRTGEKYKIVGCLDPDPSIAGGMVDDLPVLGTTDGLAEYLFSQPVDLVLLAMPLDLVPEAKALIALALQVGVPVSVVLDCGLERVGFPEDFALAKKTVRKVETVVLSNVPYNPLYLRLKRVCDLVISAALLLLLLPLFVVLAILVKITSPDGSVFYPWRVLGQNRRAFTGYKFRTMVPNADLLKEKLLQHNEMTGPVFKMRNDPRITPVGRILRTYSLDELPQLYSVLKGDMSLVGPRPPSKHEADQFAFWQRRKLCVRPGITCLWQISGRNEITNFDDWVRLDLDYIRQASLWVDFTILLKTIPAVVGRRGAH